MGTFGEIGGELLNSYSSLTSLLPSTIQQFLNFIVIVFLVVLYSIFVWKFYSSISKKNIFSLNLDEYKNSKNAALEKILAFLVYIFEYLIFFPILIFIWFSVFTIFLILLTENLAVGTLLLISATVIASIRITSYYRRRLSEDIAKLIPFTLLSISLLNPTFFSLDRLSTQFQGISLSFGDLFVFFIFIISLEVILRIVDLVFAYGGLKSEEDNENNEE